VVSRAERDRVRGQDRAAVSNLVRVVQVLRERDDAFGLAVVAEGITR
jgi:hypothetical protein